MSGPISYHEDADQITFSYRLPGRLFAPIAWLWCAVGGLPVGIGLALGLLVAGQIDDPTVDPTGLRLALGLGTLAGVLVLLGLYARAARGLRLRIIFDYARNAVVARDGRRTITVPFDDAIHFHLNAHTLQLDTRQQGVIDLLALPPDEHAAHLAGRLNAHLQAIRSVPDDDIPPMPDNLARFSADLDGLSRITGSYELPPELRPPREG